MNAKLLYMLLQLAIFERTKMNAAPGYEATVDMDRMTPHVAVWRHVFLCSLSTWPQLASLVLALGGIPSLCETPEWLPRLENVP